MGDNIIIIQLKTTNLPPISHCYLVKPMYLIYFGTIVSDNWSLYFTRQLIIYSFFLMTDRPNHVGISQVNTSWVYTGISLLIFSLPFAYCQPGV